MPPLQSEPALDQQYSAPQLDESFEQYYDPYPSLVHPAVGPVSDFYTSENLYMWPDMDGVYHWADASHARPDSCVGYSSPSFYASAYSSEAIPASDYCNHRHGAFEEPSQPSTGQGSPYVFQLAQQVRNTSTRPHAQDHRSTIARASDNFLAHASSIFSDSHSPSRRSSALDYRAPASHQASPQRETRPPSRKRSRDSLEDIGYPIKEEDDNARSSSLPTGNDACRLPQPHLTVPSQGLPSSSVRISYLSEAATSFNAQPHARLHETRSRPDERCVVQLSRQTSNKRVQRSSEEIVRQDSTILSTSTTWPIPDDPLMKGLKKPGEQKKQALACLFCRERKIACGRPPAHSPDQTCNQCARRRIKCEYPTESRRGQHKRRRKPLDGEPTAQSTVRTSSTTSVVAKTAAPPTTSTTVTPPPA